MLYDGKVADTERIQRWVLETAQLMADYPEAVRVDVVGIGERVVLRLHVRPSDVGKMIGRQGRTGRALRTICAAISQASGKWFTLDIAEEDRASGSGQPQLQ